MFKKFFEIINAKKKSIMQIKFNIASFFGLGVLKKGRIY